MFTRLRQWLRRGNRAHHPVRQRDGAALIERLEPRVLLNADPLGTLTSVTPPVSTWGPALVSSVLEENPETPLRSIVFVDAAVPDVDALLESLALDPGPSTQVVQLDGNRDGVEQIADVLAGCNDLAAVHIVSHGASGSLLLGNRIVDSDALADSGDLFKAWGAALAEDGDILLYGCNVAQGQRGVAFVRRLETLTDADIAASDNPTGSAASGGDWDLECSVGQIEASSAFSTSESAAYEHALWFTVAVMPDTQKYAEQELQPFVDQTQWIADNADTNHIAFVSHVGDVVENGALYESEWLFADAAMDILDGTAIPYSVLPGNHDYDIPGDHTGVTRFAGLDAAGNEDPAMADISFGPARYEGQSWFLGASDDELNYCQLFTADGQDYLHIALEWEPRPSSVAWAQQVIDTYPDVPVILSTHYYIDPLVDGHFLNTYSHDGYNGEELFQALVYPNPQIFLVLSGHNTTWHTISTNEAGFQVIETMTDYQARPNGGNGWMQLFEFHPETNQISVQTYSPTLDQFETGSNSQYSFDFDFDARFNFLLAPMASLAEPLDQGLDDMDSDVDAALVNDEQPQFRVLLTDVDDGVSDATVTSDTVAITKDGTPLTESVDYSFSYDAANDTITLTALGGDFTDGLYEITLNGQTAKITDSGGNELTADVLVVQIDTSIPDTLVFQQGVIEYAGTLDTDVRGAAPDSEYSNSTSFRVDGENSGSPIHGLMRFDDIFGSDPGLIPAGSAIVSAQLELTVTDNGNALTFYRMLQDWNETETWNTLDDGIQANGIEAASLPEAMTGEVTVGTLTVDVTDSLAAWANNPSSNFGWAILPTGSNGVMLDSSEGITPPKLTVVFGGMLIDTTAPQATLGVPLDGGPNDLDPTVDVVSVNTTQPYFQVGLTDEGEGIDDATVTSGAVSIRKNGVLLSDSADYTFAYSSSTREITLTPTAGAFEDGYYELILNSGIEKIADHAGNPLAATTLAVTIDTSISLPQTAVFQQNVGGYSGTLDTDVRGAAPDNEYSTSTWFRADAENSNAPIHALLQFEDIFGSDPGQIPVGAQITSAQLEFNVIDNGNALTFHRMLRDWVETETWNTLVDGIAADDVEAVSTPDATTDEVVVGPLTVDVTASLIAWANDPWSNFGWAILPTGPNGVMIDSSEGIASPKLTVEYVLASDNAAPTVTLANVLLSLDEQTDTTARLKVADIVVTDDGEGTNLLSLTGADASLFEIDGTILYLKAGAVLDYETHPALDAVVAVNDPAVGSTPDDWAELTLTITDANEPPTVSLENVTTSLMENTETTTRLHVADIAIGDDALGTNLLSLSGDDAALFEIDGTALYLKAGTVLDIATNPVLGVTVSVDDPAVGSTPDATAAMAIAVTEVNDPPTVALANTTTSLPEDTDTTARVKVADIVVTDDGFGVNILSLSGADAALFEIDGAELYLKAGVTLDHETNPVLDIEVAVDDTAVGASPDATAVLAIAVADVNESPTVSLQNAVTTLSEGVDTSVRIKVADIAVADDALGTNLLSLTGADAGLFEIDGTGLYLKAQTVLDAGANPILDVIVAVDDASVGSTPDHTVALAIAVSGAEPQTVTFQQGSDGYIGTLDTDVRGAAPDSEYSTGDWIRIDGQNGNYPIHALLRFEDIFGSGPGQIPIGTQINSAELEITLTDNGNALTLHRMLADWAETATWNTLVDGIQADDIEAVSTPDASIDEMALGTLTIDVTESLVAWANDPSSNFGWAILPTGSNGVMIDSSEGLSPPKLTVTFGGTIVDTTAPDAELEVPVDQGPNDLDPSEGGVSVSTSQSYFQIHLHDIGKGIDGTTVTSDTLAISKDGVALTESVNYSFSYESAADAITLTPTSGQFDDGTYEITLNAGPAKIADQAGNVLAETTLTVAIDTSISLPQTVILQEGTNGYAGTSDTDVRGAAPDSDYGTSTWFRVDGENGSYPIHALLKFEDIFGDGPGQIPAGSAITSAQLEITVTDNGNALTFHRMLRNWNETETWNTLVDGIQADGIEAVALPDATTGDVVVGTLTIDVTDSLIAWANDPSSNFGWAILPTGSNGVMLDSSEGLTPPKLTVVFGGTIVDTTAPEATLEVPIDQGPNDLDPTDNAVSVNTTQPYFQVHLQDYGEGLDDATVTNETLTLRRDGVALAESIDYSFSYEASTDLITLTPIGGDFGDGSYEIILNGGSSQITDVAGNPLAPTTLTVAIDTSISIPQTAIFQQNVSGYSGTLDTDVRGAAPDNDYDTSTWFRVDAENSNAPIHALLQFQDLFGSGPGQIPAGAQIVSAQLDLNVGDNGNAVTFHRMLGNWSENETWNTLVEGIQADDIEAVSTPDASTEEVAVGPLSVDVTTSLAAWSQDPSSNFGWAILPTGPNGVMIDSSEGITPPKLTVVCVMSSGNAAPTVSLQNVLTSLSEATDTTVRLKVADIVVTDDGEGTNLLSLSGADAALFEIDDAILYLKAGTILDQETNPILDVTVEIDDASVGTTPDDTASIAIAIETGSEVTTFYVSQSGAGSGATAGGPASIADFNAGAGSFSVLDGATVYFLGTITTTIDPADSGTAEARVVLRGDYLGQECTVAGGGSLAVGIDVADDDYITLAGFTVQDTSAYAISVGSAAAGTIIDGCTIEQTAGRGIAFQSPITITGTTLTATGGSESVYSQLGAAGGDVVITANTFNFNHTGTGLFIRGYGAHTISGNDINLSAGSAILLSNYGTGDEGGSIAFTGNDVDSSVAPAGPLVSLNEGNWAVTISDNTFDLTAAALSDEVIRLNGLAGPVISGNTMNVADDVACIYLTGDGQGAIATISNNALTHTGGDGNSYVIRVGQESTNGTDNTYDGVVITDNKITGFDPLGNCHAVFVGFNRNAVIARNYISNAGYGIVVKGTEGTDYTAGGVMYNVIYNCDIGIRIKGVDDVVVVNNTVYSPHGLILTHNVGGDESTGVVLKNNIFAGTGGTLFQIGDTTDLSTIDATDYATNCVYGYPPSDYVKYHGVSYTYAEWAALGYANGSINADPRFTDLAAGDLTLRSDSPCLNVGTNLGLAYDDGLDPLSLWPLSVNMLDQDDFGAGWEIGAYIFV